MEEKGLTPRQQLIYEAFQKIHTGNQLRRDGLIELNNLIPPEKGAVANRTLKAPNLFRKGLNEKQLIERVLGQIGADSKVTRDHVMTKFGLSRNRATRLLAKMHKQKLLVKETSTAGHSHNIWVKSKAKRGSTKLISETFYADKILEYLKNTSWITSHKLCKDLKLTWYPAKRNLNYLVSKGLVKIVTRTNNPEHVGLSSFNRKIDYWELT